MLGVNSNARSGRGAMLRLGCSIDLTIAVPAQQLFERRFFQSDDTATLFDAHYSSLARINNHQPPVGWQIPAPRLGGEFIDGLTSQRQHQMG